MEKVKIELPQPPGAASKDGAGKDGAAKGGGLAGPPAAKGKPSMPKSPSGLVTETWDTVSDTSATTTDTISDKGTAVAEMAGDAKAAAAEAGSQAAEATSTDPCEALAELEFDFEMPEVTETTVTGTYVYAG